MKSHIAEHCGILHIELDGAEKFSVSENDKSRIIIYGSGETATITMPKDMLRRLAKEIASIHNKE